LGNFVTTHELLGHGVPGEVIRLALLSTHYRDPLDWTEERLTDSWQNLDRFYRGLNLPAIKPDKAAEPFTWISEALEDDLNTPMAIARLHALLGNVNRATDDVERGRLQAELAVAGQLLGLFSIDPNAWTANKEIASEEILGLLDARNKARLEKRFADADRIRDELSARGIVIEDRRDAPSIAYRRR
jgi:cysteinyl-tRNA synthetase